MVYTSVAAVEKQHRRFVFTDFSSPSPQNTYVMFPLEQQLTKLNKIFDIEYPMYLYVFISNFTISDTSMLI